MHGYRLKDGDAVLSRGILILALVPVMLVIVSVSSGVARNQSRTISHSRRVTTGPAPYRGDSAAKTIPIPTQWHGPAVHEIPTQWPKSDLYRYVKHRRGRRAVSSRRRASAAHRAAPPVGKTPAAAGTVIITRSQDQKSVKARVGQLVELHLDKGLHWQVEGGNGRVLMPLKVGNANATYRAIAPGTASIKAYGRMIPKPGEMVAQFVMVFQVTVEVVR